MKHTQIDRAQGAHVKCEPGGQDQRADGFYNQRDGHDDLHESDESFHAERAEHLHHHHALSKTDAAAERQQQKRGHGGVAKPSHLNPRQNDQLPEEREVFRRIQHDQTRHADGGRHGEEGVNEVNALRARRRERQHEQQAREQDKREQGDGDDLGG